MNGWVARHRFVTKTIAPGDPGASPQNDEEAQMPTATTKPTTAKDAAAEQTRVERTTELSEQVLEQVKGSQKKAIEAVRRFMESVDEALPPHGENPSRRQEVIDSALEMSEKLVQTQYDFLTGVVHSAGEALGASGKKKA
jgi:hypothetical protein